MCIYHYKNCLSSGNYKIGDQKWQHNKINGNYYNNYVVSISDQEEAIHNMIYIRGCCDLFRFAYDDRIYTPARCVRLLMVSQWVMCTQAS